MNLEQFIIKAKTNGWVGALKGEKKIEASRIAFQRTIGSLKYS